MGGGMEQQQDEAAAAAAQPLLSPAAAAAAARRPAADTFWPCVANLSKVIIGAGMMAIPQAYCRIGSLAGTSMLVLVGLMTYSTLVFLLNGSQATGATTYSQLTRVLCGPAVMKVLQLAVLSFCFGFGVVYLVIIRDILLGTPPDCNGLLCELFGFAPTSVWYDSRLVILGVAVLVCCPLLLLRTMDRLAVLNVVGVGAIGMLALTALGLAAKGLLQGTAYPIPVLPQWQLLGKTTAEQLQALMAVMPVMIACYVAHQSLHPLMPLLQPYSDARMRRVIAGALLIAFAVFGSLAVGSSLAFGPTLEVNVLNNYSVSGLQPLAGPLLARALSWAIRGGYLLSLLASLLLYMHPLRACLAEMIWPDKPDSQAAGGSSSTNEQGVLASGEAPSLSGRAGVQHAAAGPNQQLAGSTVFANAAAQAAAAAAASSSGSSSGSRDVVRGGQNRQLATFDSLDNPRTGSWSGVRYLTSPEPAGSGQQPRKDSGSSKIRSFPIVPDPQTATAPTQQHTARRPQHGVTIIVTDASSGPGAEPLAAASTGRQYWQTAEQQWYYYLTYGLLSAMVLVAIVVPNIWTALSAIGDLASTLQAFVVPGLIGILLSRRRAKLGMASSRTARARLQQGVTTGTGVFACFLGMALFVNGIYQRV